MREKQWHVETAQWGLGAYERFLAGEGEQWLQAAAAAGDHLLEIQEPGGAWLHLEEMPHTYELRPPWISAMAQGECASLLVRLFKQTDQERYADAALRGLAVARIPSSEGGASALLDGHPFPEEYPTDPPSFVLNGGIFALWGFYDVGIGLGDSQAASDFETGSESLARNIHRWDAGHWSYYDLFPHPIRNIASSAYHQLHIAQLRAMNMIAPRPQIEAAADRWQGYADNRLDFARSFARKAAFRLAVPRTRDLAHRLPWSHAKRSAATGHPARNPLVLAYHAVSPDWPSPLAVSPGQLREQLTALVRKGYRGATFAQVATGQATGKVFAVTFDDGCRSVLEHGYPVLAELGLPATIFVPTDWVGSDRPMSWPGIEQWSPGPHSDQLLCLGWEQLRGLQSEGWEIASHTRSHPRLPEIDDEALREELVGSRQACERELGRPCLTLAYPYGEHDARVEAAAREAGYAAAATMKPGEVERYRWPRIGVYAGDTPWRFALKASRGVRGLRASSPGKSLERLRH